MNREIIYLSFSIIFALSSFVTCQSGSRVKSVTTYLNAKWLDTSLLLEAAEYIADENPASFWLFIEAVNGLDFTAYEDNTEESKYDDILQVSSQFLSPSQIKLLKFSLALRVYSPKVEMFRQISSDRELPTSPNCLAPVDINGVFACKMEDIQELVGKTDAKYPTMLEIDHYYPGGEHNPVGAVLYGEIGTKEFKEMHDTLKHFAETGHVNYVLRPVSPVKNERKVRLSGYGVELQIKSTEYKAQDDTKLKEESNADGTEHDSEEEIEGFLFSKLKTLHPDHTDDLNALRAHLVESSHDMAPLKVWQLQHLSMQAAQRIMSVPENERLGLFTSTAQNFPSLARSLIRTKVDDKLKREIIKNQNHLRSSLDINPSDAALFINGIYYDLDFTDIYTLLDQIKNEQRIMERLFKLGIRGDKLSRLLQLDMSETKQDYGIDIRDSAIMWLNDIENDKTYRRWPSSTGELLRPAFPGMLRSIRKNFHNFVVIIDPSHLRSLGALRLIDGFVANVTPIRFGIVLATNANKSVSGLDDPGVAVLCAFNYLVQSYDDREDANFKGMQFLVDLYSTVHDDLTVAKVTDFFKNLYPSEDIEDIFGSDSDYDVGRQLAKMFVDKGGFKNLPLALMNGVPLPEKALTEEEFEETVIMEVMRNTQTLQKAVYKGDLDDSKDVVDWFMAQPNIMPRLNNRILTTKTSTYLDMSGDARPLSKSDFAPLNGADMIASISSSCHYVTTKTDPAVRPLTVWVVGDYETAEGRALLLSAVRYTRESNALRICGLHNTDVKSRPGLMSRLVQVALTTLSAPVARQFLVKILEEENVSKLLSGQKKPEQFGGTGFDSEAFNSRLDNLKEDVFYIHSTFVSKMLNLPVGKRTVVANGRALGAFDPLETFSEEDFALLEKFFTASIGEKISLELSDLSLVESSDLLMKASSVLLSKSDSKSRAAVSLRGEEHSVVTLGARDLSTPAFDILAVCDPVSGAAQKMGHLLRVLHEVLNANVRVALNAVEKHSEMPLKSFYRLVLDAEPRFADSGEMGPGPSARFVGLPEAPILTQNYHVPENWLVEVVKSVHDLDNIKLESVETGVVSEFELEHLLLEGHCFEQATGNPPRGLQFTLGTRQQPLLVDTIVMANLGYFQLKANPGAMILRLREGRSTELYNIFSHEGTDTTTPDEKGVTVVLSSFRSHVVKVRVAKNPGMQNVDLMLDEEEEGGGLWGSITSTFSGSRAEDDDEDSTINIFSVASGHLYERFLRIMMVSVKRRTAAPVKFWFLKNFLSPSLKDSLPWLATELGFQYELVQYKWPRWLHQQTEKQRIIWGYKILFLDVLFPLDVRKIIFVDADQVVRGDLKELYNLDLEGAPYGFVPFCDSRKEMEGFRFWKQGYWRNHLAGRRYHISALFVVDLKKFRRIAAGDRLRGQYQGLSQDPNSLSNLDQDLPNNMVHQVKIRSLPMEWLWCETWCDEASKSAAKVIDLCNNPLTKEAKLDAAHRIITEWQEYDTFIKSIMLKYSGSKPIKNNSNSASDDSDIKDDTHSEL